MTRWNWDVFGNVRKELEVKKKLLLQVEREAVISGANCKVRELKATINILLDREARLWSQRSRIFYLRNRDNNTKFFHNKATMRHRKNIIRGIFDESNSWHHQQDEISGVLLKYYQELFSTSNLVSSNATLTYVPHVITEDMNNMLTRYFLEGEVKMALK